MIIYSKSGIKSKKIIARIYIKDDCIILRLYLNKIDKHRNYIENTPEHIKSVFINDNGRCDHCHNENNGKCKFRKAYTLDGKFIEKCNGKTFEFHHPNIEKLEDYLELLSEFY